MQRSTSGESLVRFESALRLLPELPAGSARDQQELAIRVAMVMPISLVRGFGAAEVEANLKRARELCDQTGAAAGTKFQVLHGLSAHYAIVANFERARSLAVQILELGAKCGDDIVTCIGYFDLGGTYVWAGEFPAAAKALQQAVGIYERLLHGSPQAVFGPMMFLFPLVFGIQQLSWTFWILGFPEKALHQIDRLQDIPEHLRASFQTAQILNADFEVRSFFLRDYGGWRAKAEAVIKLSRENGFAFLDALGTTHLGQIMVHDGEFDHGIRTIIEGMESIRATGEILASGWNNTHLAESLLTAGRAAEGLGAVEQAIAAAEQLHIQAHEAEAHRLKGELLLLSGAPQSEAEASMRRAIAIAQGQEAKGWELRAATSLARLLCRQRRIGEARDILAPVYNWFTEGLDTADLKDAKALLDELGT
jgi:tetratricopeptide (TPR) repeat protein